MISLYGHKGDVLGIGPHVAVHNLFASLDYPLVRQKRRKFEPKHLKVIEEEMTKFIKANIIKEVHYPNWLSNVVVAPTKDKSGEYVLTSPTSTRPTQKTIFHYQKLI